MNTDYTAYYILSTDGTVDMDAVVAKIRDLSENGFDFCPFHYVKPKKDGWIGSETNLCADDWVNWDTCGEEMKELSRAFPFTTFSVYVEGEDAFNVKRLYLQNGQLEEITPVILWPEPSWETRPGAEVLVAKLGSVYGSTETEAREKAQMETDVHWGRTRLFGKTAEGETYEFHEVHA